MKLGMDRSIISGIAVAASFGVAACAGAYDRTAYADGPRPVAADTCLRSNQIQSWDVVDSRTMVVENTRGTQFEVNLVGVCPGIDSAQFALGFESFSELSCLRSGDEIHYDDPAFGYEVCTIANVQPISEYRAASLLD